MAVPSSGSISWFGLSQEKKINDYTSAAGAGAIPVISMYDLVNGGNSTGNTQPDYAITNTYSSSHPNTSTPHAASEWYSYDHDATSGLGGDGSDWHSSSYYSSGNVYYNSNGTSVIGHTSKANACNDTTTAATCTHIMWRGTLGNGTTMYWNYGNTFNPLAILNGTSSSLFVRPWSTWNNITISGGTTTVNGQSTGNDAVFQVNSSGVVSNFGSCAVSLTGYPITATNYSKPGFSCYQSTSSATVYLTHSNPIVNTTIAYSNSGGTTFQGVGFWGVNVLSNQSNRKMTVGANGVVTSFSNC